MSSLKRVILCQSFLLYIFFFFYLCMILYNLTTDLDWFDLCDLPSCCTALSALHGNSTVRCTLLLWLGQRMSACKEIPADIEYTNYLMADKFS